MFLQQGKYRGNEAAIKLEKKLVGYTVCSGSFILCLASVINNLQNSKLKVLLRFKTQKFLHLQAQLN